MIQPLIPSFFASGPSPSPSAVPSPTCLPCAEACRGFHGSVTCLHLSLVLFRVLPHQVSPLADHHSELAVLNTDPCFPALTVALAILFMLLPIVLRIFSTLEGIPLITQVSPDSFVFA